MVCSTVQKQDAIYQKASQSYQSTDAQAGSTAVNEALRTITTTRQTGTVTVRLTTRPPK